MISLLLLIAAVVCFAVAVLVAVTTAALGSFDGWLAGGLLAWALSALVAALEARAARYATPISS